MRDFFIYLLKSGLCLAVFLLIYQVLLRKETFFRLNRFYLLASMTGALIIPLNTISPSIFTRTLEKIVLISGLWRPAITNSAGESVFSSSQNLSGPSIWTPFAIFVLIYFSGAAILSFRFLINLIRIIHMIRRYGLTRGNGDRIVFTDHVISPFSFLNILFISRIDSVKSEYKKIMTHERIHIRQWHTLDLFFSELLIILQWMNPFVWPYKRALQETHEFLADAGVIAQGFDAADYQLLIVEQNVGGRLFGFSSSFHHTQIKRRIHMIQKFPSNGKNRFKFLILFPVLLFLMFLSAGLTRFNPANAMHMVMQPVLDPFSDVQAGYSGTAQEKQSDPIQKIEQADIGQNIDSTKSLQEFEKQRIQAEREKEQLEEKRIELEKKRSELDQEKLEVNNLTEKKQQQIAMLETDLKDIQIKVAELKEKREALLKKGEALKQAGDTTGVVQEKIVMTEEKILDLKKKADAIHKKLQVLQQTSVE